MSMSELVRRRGKSRGMAVLRRNWLVALLAATFLVTIVALGGAIRTTAEAAPHFAEAPGAWARLADGGGMHAYPEFMGPVYSANASAAQAYPTVASRDDASTESEAGFEAVWLARMTVGYASDSNTTYWGYMPGQSSTPGALDSDWFQYEGQTFVIQNLFLQQVRGGITQLVLNTDQRLPDELVFQAGVEEFRVRDALALGANNNIHAWRLESGLGWNEGETFQVGLWQVFEFGSQEGAPCEGPEPLNSLPANARVDGTIAVGESLIGEITAIGQFKFFKLLLEPGKEYRLDMQGAATGRGTLSDPWISGINGAFQTPYGPQLQPVWYDEEGRSSTSLQLPSGQEVLLDQYGRMYAVGVGEAGETIARAVMGANDDGGKGFNARLFLVNFPGEEYRIAVSGSQNPSPLGTFTISLTDVSQDDYSADSGNEGALSVGGFVAGNLEVPGDVDWFAVDLVANTAYRVIVEGLETGDSPLGQPRLAGIFESGSQSISGTSADLEGLGSNRNNSPEFTPSSDGVYYIAVASFRPYMPNRSTLPAGPYRLSIEAES